MAVNTVSRYRGVSSISLNTIMASAFRQAEGTHKTTIPKALFGVLPIRAVNP
jgi:hypothetical protein